MRKWTSRFESSRQFLSFRNSFIDIFFSWNRSHSNFIAVSSRFLESIQIENRNSFQRNALQETDATRVHDSNLNDGTFFRRTTEIGNSWNCVDDVGIRRHSTTTKESDDGGSDEDCEKNEGDDCERAAEFEGRSDGVQIVVGTGCGDRAAKTKE